MEIFVSDTNIFIDLFNCGSLNELFRLSGASIHTTDWVISELTKLEQQQAVSKYVEEGSLAVKTWDGEGIARIFDYKQKVAGNSNLSMTDCGVLCYTKDLGNAKLLTGDHKLRSHAEKEGLDVSGILFLFDEFIEEGLLQQQEAADRLELLQQTNKRLPKEEVEKRIIKWRK